MGELMNQLMNGGPGLIPLDGIREEFACRWDAAPIWTRQSVFLFGYNGVTDSMLEVGVPVGDWMFLADYRSYSRYTEMGDDPVEARSMMVLLGDGPALVSAEFVRRFSEPIVRAAADRPEDELLVACARYAEQFALSAE
jgi:hypothetical protein